MTPSFSICPTHGYIAGEHQFCPQCDVEVLARKRRELLPLGHESVNSSAVFSIDDPLAAIEEIRLEESERQACEVWTRVMGYHRPVSEYNPGKKSEYAERTPYRECRL